MHWIVWVILGIWVICAVANCIFLKKMECDAVLRGEGGYFWILFSPFWTIPIWLSYRHWEKHHGFEANLREIKERHRKRKTQNT